MLKKLDKLLNSCAPWSYLLLIFAAIAFAALAKFDVIDGATGMAINAGLFGLGLSGVWSWSNARHEKFLREFQQKYGQQDNEE